MSEYDAITAAIVTFNRIPPDFDPALHGTLNKYHGR
jgi:hypothetical protein